jgi:hypothetical protein
MVIDYPALEVYVDVVYPIAKNMLKFKIKDKEVDYFGHLL